MVWPEALVRLATALHRAGGQVYLVGGALRDLLLGRTPRDFDLATDLLPEQTLRVAQAHGWRAVPTGIRFGTVTVWQGDLPVEVTTFRSESGYRDGRRPDEVVFGVSIERDLARRDFSINAMALSWPEGIFVDPWQGVNDLHRGLIRAVGEPGERFREDGLRMLRAIRLAGELDFTVEPATFLAVSCHCEGILRVARERVGAEMDRLMTAPAAVHGLQQLFRSGLGFVLLPEFLPCLGFPQDPAYHAHPVLEHILEVVRLTPSDRVLRWAALFHDVAKPYCATRAADGRMHFHGHDRMGARILEHVLRNLRMERSLIESAGQLVVHHMFPLDMGDRGLRRMLARLGGKNLFRLVHLKLADMVGSGGTFVPQAFDAWSEFHHRCELLIRETTALTVRDLAIDGHDIMRILSIPPGPRVGRILRTLLEEVLENPELNERSWLIERLQTIDH